MTKTPQDPHGAFEASLDLDALFVAARADKPKISADFAERLVIAADAHMPQMAPPTICRAPRKGIAALFDEYFGWRGAVSFASCALCGIWLGFSGAGDVALASSFELLSGSTDTTEYTSTVDDFFYGFDEG